MLKRPETPAEQLARLALEELTRLADDQFRTMVMIEGGLETLYRQDANVFMAADLFWRQPGRTDARWCAVELTHHRRHISR